tara:strand:- start:492909 stop:493223 length:315 start_codon:yes stop_codon:yes gene_type:complete
MSALFAIVLTGLGTYFSRAAFILAFANRRIPPRLLLILEYVAPAVLGALVVAMLTGHNAGGAPGYPELLGLLAAGITAWKTHNHVFTLLAGMGVFWALAAVMPL